MMDFMDFITMGSKTKKEIKRALDKAKAKDKVEAEKKEVFGTVKTLEHSADDNLYIAVDEHGNRKYLVTEEQRMAAMFSLMYNRQMKDE